MEEKIKNTKQDVPIDNIFKFSTKDISDEQLEIVIENYYSEMENLYKIMSTLTWDEYRKQFSKISNDLRQNSGQNILLPNTAWIEIREFEVFGKCWSDDMWLVMGGGI